MITGSLPLNMVCKEKESQSGSRGHREYVTHEEVAAGSRRVSKVAGGRGRKTTYFCSPSEIRAKPLQMMEKMDDNLCLRRRDWRCFDSPASTWEGGAVRSS